MPKLSEATRNKLITEITGPKLSQALPDQLRRVSYSEEPRYNCLIGEELQEHPRRSD